MSGVGGGIIGLIVGGSTVGNIVGGRDERWKSMEGTRSRE